MSLLLDILAAGVPFIWVAALLWLFNLISQHSIAFYATRARRSMPATSIEGRGQLARSDASEPISALVIPNESLEFDGGINAPIDTPGADCQNGTDHRLPSNLRGDESSVDCFEVRVFLQNLEDVPLKGWYELAITVSPALEFVIPPALYAGPIQFDDEIAVPRGNWKIRFSELPPYDTWMVAFVTREACEVSVIMREIAEKDGKIEAVSRALRVLTTDGIDLPANRRHIRSGIGRSPSPPTYWSAVTLMLIGYLGMREMSFSYACGHSLACYGRGFIANLDRSDAAISILMVALVSTSFYVGRRSAPPFAQGYLAKSAKWRSKSIGDTSKVPSKNQIIAQPSSPD